MALFAAAAFLFIFTGYASASYTGDFLSAGGAVYDGGDFDEAYAVAVDTVSVGGPYLYVAGASSRAASGLDYFLVKYDASGVMLASATYAGGYEDRARGIALDPHNGAVYVTGESFNGSRYNVFTVKYTTALEYVSSHTFESAFSSHSSGFSVAADRQNPPFIYVAGDINNGSDYDYLLIKYDADLVFISSAVYNAGADDFCRSVAVSTVGAHIYAAGYSYGATYDYRTVKYDSSLNFVSSATFDGAGSGSDRAYAVATAPSGDVIVAGESDNGSAIEFRVLRYSPFLALLSSAGYAHNGAETRARGAAVAANSDIYVTGFAFNGADTDYLTARYSSTLATRLSTATYDSSQNDYAMSVAAGISSYVYVTGYSGISAAANFRTLRFSADGAPPDTTPPATVEDLSAQPGNAAGQVKLTWSAPGDDGATGALPPGSAFKIQVSSVSDGTGDGKTGWLYQNAQITVSTSGVTPTTLVSYVVAGLVPASTYYFKIWHADEVPNWSGLSNTATSWAQVPQAGLWKSVQGGGWSNGAIWDKGSVPHSLSVVEISHTVTFDMFETESSTINVMNLGTLQFDGAVSSRALVVAGNLEIMNGGKFLMPPNTGYISALKIKCNASGEFGVIVNNGGVFDVRGNTTTTPSTRNTLITSANPANKTYIRNLSQTEANFNMYYVEVSSVGVDDTSKRGITFDGAGTRGKINYSNIHNGYYGIYLTDSSNNTLSNNSVYSNTDIGIYLEYGSNNTLINNSVYSNPQGIYLNGSSNNTLRNNSAYSHSFYGIYIYNSSNNNTISNNRVYSNTYQGICIISDSNDNTLSNNSVYSNSIGIELYQSSNNTAVNCDFGKDGNNTSGDIGYRDDPNNNSTLILKSCNLYSTTKVNTTYLDDAGAYVVSYNQNGEAGTAKIWGDYNIPNGKAEKFNYADLLYVSTATQPNSTLKGAGSITYPTTEDGKTQTEFWEVRYNGSSFDVKRGTGPVLAFDGIANVGSGYYSGDRGVGFTASGTFQPDDAFYFVTISSSGDQGVQKKIEFNDSPVGTKLTVDAGGALEMIGAPGNPTISTASSSGVYYGFNSSGTLNFNNYIISNTSSTGLSIYGGSIVNLSSGTFANIRPAVAPSSAAYINVSGVTSNATFYGCVFEGGPADYNVKADGSGINWTFKNWSGPKGGPAYTSAVNGATVNWESPPPNVKIWDGGGADSLASNALNWVNDVAPQNGDSIIFGSTNPTKGCLWDIGGISFSSFTMSVDYSSSVVLNDSFTVDNDFTLAGGTFNAAGIFLNIRGNWTHSGGNIAVSTGGITFNGSTLQEIYQSPGSFFPVRVQVYSSNIVRAVSDLEFRQPSTFNPFLIISSGTFEAGASTLTFILQGANNGQWWPVYLDTSGIFLPQTSTVKLLRSSGTTNGFRFEHNLNFNNLIIDNHGVDGGVAHQFTGPADQIVTADYFEFTEGSLYAGGKFIINGNVVLGVPSDYNKTAVLSMQAAGSTITVRGSFTTYGMGGLELGAMLELGGNFTGSIDAAGSNSVITSTSPGNVFPLITLDRTYQYTGLKETTFDSIQGVVISTWVQGGYYSGVAFSSITFQNLKPGATAVTYTLSGDTQTWANLNFADTTMSVNVSAPNLVWPGFVALPNAFGPRSGPAYENDPNNVIFWSTPTAPSGFDAAAVSTSGIKWFWTDNSNDEKGYRLKNSTGAVIADLSYNTTEFVLTGLAPNASAAALVEAYNPIGASTRALVAKYTLADIPSGLYLSNVTSHSVTANWSANGNPAGTFYDLEYSTSPDFTPYDEVYGTIALAEVCGPLLADTTYYFRTNARNFDSINTGFSAVVSTLTLAPPPAGPDKVWSRSADLGSGLASSAANWSPFGVPADGDAVYFNATSTQSCAWDIAGLTLSSFTMTSGYTGQVNLSTNVFVDGGFLKTGGAFSIGNSILELTGDFTSTAGSMGAGTTGKILFSGSTVQYLNASGMVTFEVASSSEVVNITSGFMSVNGNVFLTSGVLRAGNEIRVGGDWTQAGGVFDAQSSTVTFDSINLSQDIMTLTVNPFNHFKVNATTNVYVYSTVDVNGVFTLDTGTLSLVSGGRINANQSSDIMSRFEVNAGTFSSTGMARVLSGGELDLSGAAASTVRLATGINIGAGGRISANSALDVIKSSAAGQYYSFTVASGALNVTGLTLDGLNAAGLVAQSGSLIQNLNNVNFKNAAAGAVALQILSGGTSIYTFSNHYFDASVSTNVYAPNLTAPGYINMSGATGPKSGYNYENDPNGRIFWGAPETPTGADSVAVGISSITWGWTDNAYEEESYRISRVSDGAFLVQGLSINTTYWTQTGFSPNTSEQITVEALNVIGGAGSTPSPIRYTLAAVPTGLYLTNVTSHSVTANWSPNGNPSGTQYYVECSSVGTGFIPVLSNSGWTTQINWVATSLQPNTTYWFRAQSRNVDAIATAFDTTVSTATLPDPVKPASGILYPAHSSYCKALNVISGTAAATGGASIAEVQVFLFDIALGKYWNGVNAWSLDAESWFSAAVYPSSWTYDVSAAAFQNDKEYRVVSRAIDTFSNYETLRATAVFRIDTALPASGVAYPVNNSAYSSLGVVSGTAADAANASFNSGVSSVKIRLLRQSDGFFWDGAVWVVGESWLDATGSGAWSYNSLPAFTSGYYIVNSRSYDVAGNDEVAFSTSAFYISGPATRLILTIPGETFQEGAAPGKIGTPASRTAGSAFMITAFAVDDNYYLDASANAGVFAVTSDGYDVEPATRTLVGGTTTFALNLLAAGTSQITISASVLTSAATSVVVLPSVPTRIQLLVPGETAAPGKVMSAPYGKTGTPATQITGQAFNVTVMATDDYWNIQPASNPVVNIITSDPADSHPPDASLVSGEKIFSVIFVTAGSWTVCATDIDGTPLESSTSTVVNVLDNTPPAAVTDITGQPGVSDGAIVLNWPAPGDNGGASPLPAGSMFKIQHSTWAGVLWSTTAAQITVSTSGVTPTAQVAYTVAGLTGWTTYYFKLWHADNAPNWSELSNTATSYAADFAAPGVPSLISPSSATAANLLAVDFSWNPSTDSGSGVAGYELYISTSGDPAVFVSSTATVSTSVNVVLPNQGAYQWRVRAKDKAGNFSTYSAAYTLTVDTTSSSAPAAPTSLSGTVISTVSVRWNWLDNATNETGYRLQNAADEIIIDGLAVDTTFYVESTLSPNTQYVRRVRAYNGAGASAKSNDAAVYTPANPPSNLTSLSRTAASISLSWTAGGGGNTRFAVARSSDGILYQMLVAWADAKVGTNYTDAGSIKPDTTYFYRVAGYNGDAVITAFTSVIAVKSESVPPDTISGKITQADGKTPIAALRVDAAAPDGTSVYFVHTSTDGSYTISAVAPGKYRVQAGWALNDIVSSVYKDEIYNGSVGVDFTLEVSFAPSAISGVIRKADAGVSAPKVRRVNGPLAPEEQLGETFVEILKDGVIALRVYADRFGYFEIGNLMPGGYVLRAFNGLAYSAPKAVSLAEGQMAVPAFAFSPIAGSGDDVYAYPNPARGSSAAIRFKAGVASPKIELKIYNIAAELIRSADQNDFAASGAGVYKFDWDLNNSSGKKVASGVYIYVLKVSSEDGEESVVKKKLAIIK